MAAITLGKLTINNPGTPVRLTNNQADANLRVASHALLVQALPTNTGLVYIGKASTMDRDSLAQVLAILPIPTPNSIPAFEIIVPLSPNGLNAADYYVDADVAGNGVLVSGFVT